MFKPKYEIEQEVFVVQDYKVVKCVIERINFIKSRTGDSLQYSVIPIMNGEAKGKERNVSEAYIVKDLETARQSALINWDNIYNAVKKQLQELKEDVFITKNDSE